MATELRILGLAPQANDRQLSAALVVVDGPLDAPSVKVLAPWRGAARTSLPRQLFALREILFNAIDEQGPARIALRRPDGGRGGPTLSYDEKISFSAVAGLVAVERSLGFEQYRGNQLQVKPGDEDVDRHVPRDGRDALTLAAVAAALTDLRGTGNRGEG